MARFRSEAIARGAPAEVRRDVTFGEDASQVRMLQPVQQQFHGELVERARAEHAAVRLRYLRTSNSDRPYRGFRSVAEQFRAA